MNVQKPESNQGEYRSIYGLKAIKPKQTLVEPTAGNCKELNSYLYNCGWFLYIWGKFYAFEGIYTFEGPTIVY